MFARDEKVKNKEPLPAMGSVATSQKVCPKPHFPSIHRQSHLLLAIFQLFWAPHLGCWSKFALGADLGAPSVEDERDRYHGCSDAAEWGSRPLNAEVVEGLHSKERKASAGK